MTLIACYSLGLSAESLLSETARLRGFKRMRRYVRTALTEAHKELIRGSALILRDGYVTISYQG